MSANIDEIRKLLKGLSRQDLEELNSEITEQLEKSIGLNDFLNTCAENRFSEGLVCPYCGKKHIVKFGRVIHKRATTRRYDERPNKSEGVRRPVYGYQEYQGIKNTGRFSGGL